MGRTLGRSLPLAVTGVLAAALVTACAAGPEKPSALSAVPPDRVSTEIFHGESMSLVQYARNTLQASCMDAKGYPQLKQAGVERFASPFADLDTAAPTFATVSDEHARTLGFGRHEPAQVANVVSFDAGFDKAFLACRTEASREIGHGVAEVESQIADLYNTVADERVQALNKPAERAETDRAVQALLDCVEKRGFRPVKSGDRTLETYGIGRPTGRHDGAEPPEPERKPGTVVVLPRVPERRYHPAPAESRLAVATAQCARQTRYAERIGGQWTRLLLEVLSKHESEIMELRPKIEKIAKSAARVVGR